MVWDRKREADGLSQHKENPMNWDRVEGQWKQFSGKVREKWGKLTDSDLEVIKGKRDQLVGKVQERYGIAKDAAQKQVDEFADTLDDQTDVDDIVAERRARTAGR
jgi:uncharacterized protein YjbJ (UPF0337 family)